MNAKRKWSVDNIERKAISCRFFRLMITLCDRFLCMCLFVSVLKCKCEWTCTKTWYKIHSVFFFLFASRSISVRSLTLCYLFYALIHLCMISWLNWRFQWYFRNKSIRFFVHRDFFFLQMHAMRHIHTNLGMQ